MKSPYLTFVALIILALFVSCRPSSPPPNPPLITVELTGTEARASYEETITQPNCGGSAEAENTVGRSRSIKYEIEVQHGLEVNANGQIGFAGTDIELGATVASQLGHSYGNEETLSRSVTVKASPRTNMVHRIKQEEVWQVGTATIVVGGSQMIIPFSFRHDFSVQLVDSYDRKDCDTLVAEPPTEADSQSSPNATERPTTECSFPQIGWTPPELLENGEWIYSCLSAGQNNWVGQDESWKAANWKRGSGQSEIVNIVIPEGAVTMGIGCDPCTILKPDGSTISSTGGNFGPFQPNLEIEVSPGELYKARIFGADSCPTRPSAIPPCSPEIYIWFNLRSSNIPSSPRPSPYSINSGGEFGPLPDWLWICTGDFRVRQSNGAVVDIHDQLEKTGAVVVLEPGSSITLIAPKGGNCQAYTEAERAIALDETINLMLSDPNQCVGGCNSVSIYILDAFGEIVDLYSRP